jgi:2'-5' RNA ligase
MTTQTRPQPDKFFLCLGFDNFCQADLKPFHVTLIYFGELTPEELEEVKTITNDYVNEGNLDFLASLRIAFHEKDLFGKDKNIPVLKPTDTVHNHVAWQKCKALVELVKKYRKHDDFDFNPHLTTGLSMFRGRFDSLYLCKNSYEVVDAWDLEG